MNALEEIIDEYDAYDRDHPEYTKEDIIKYVLREINDIDYSNSIDEIKLLKVSYNNHLEKILEILDDNNFNEVARLIDFLVFSYQQELVHLEATMNPLNEDYIEIYHDKWNFNDKQLVFNEFIETKINMFRSVKTVEKKLKI